MNLHIDAGADQIAEAYFETGFVRLESGQPLSQEKLLTLARVFGDLLPIEKHTGCDPALQIVGHDGLFGKSEVPWHSDYSYGRGAFYGTLLYNADNGAEAATHFVDMEEVCAALSPAETDRLSQMKGHYSAHKHLRSTFFSSDEAALMKQQEIIRPLVFRHPSTGHDVLYISPATLRNVSGGEIDMASLIGLVEQKAWVHRWQPYDVLLYDNLRLMHRRPPFTGRRTLWRIQFDPNYDAHTVSSPTEPASADCRCYAT